MSSRPGIMLPGQPVGGSGSSPPPALSYATPDFRPPFSLPTRLALVFAGLVVPALLVTPTLRRPWHAANGSIFAPASAAAFGAASVTCCLLGNRRLRRTKAGPWRRGASAPALVLCLTLGSAGVTLGGGALLIEGTTRRTGCGYSPRHHCERNMRQVVLAAIMYSYENNGRLPNCLDDVLSAGEVTSDVFICPVQAASPPAGGTIPYVYLGRGLKNDIGPEVVVLHDRPGDHTDGMNVAYGDGHVEWHDLPASKKILAELAAGHNPPRREKLK